MTSISFCSGACRGNGACDCGGVADGMLQVDRTVHFGLMLKDAALPTAPTTTRGRTMDGITLSEKRDLVIKAYGEAAVRRMKEEGAKSDAYKAAYAQAVGETFVSEKDQRFIEGFYESLIAGKTVEQIEELQTGGARNEAAYDHMCHQQAEAWKGNRPVNDNARAPTAQFARDGRPMSSLTDQQRAYEEMCIRDAKAWDR